MRKVNLAEKFEQIDDDWHPRVAGQVNNMHIKLVKIQGEFDWHTHAEQDEMFFVISGSIVIELRDEASVPVGEGEFVIVPHGTEHRPVAHERAELMLVEPAGTINTGDVVSDKTVTSSDFI